MAQGLGGGVGGVGGVGGGGLGCAGGASQGQERDTVGATSMFVYAGYLLVVRFWYHLMSASWH